MEETTDKLISILSIAGSDSSGGAGIQADLKAASLCRVYAATAITAVTAQSTYGVSDIIPLPEDIVKQQIVDVFSDRIPGAIKIGMLGHVRIGRSVIETLEELNYSGPIIVDPVLSATSGRSFADDKDALIDFYKNELGPIAWVFTPNIPEARVLSGYVSTDEDDEFILCDRLLKIIHCRGIALKGGHGNGGIMKDFFMSDIEKDVVMANRVSTGNLHGTGCTFSTIMACGMAQRFSMSAAFKYASDLLHSIIESSIGYEYGNPGNGPLNCFNYKFL